MSARAFYGADLAHVHHTGYGGFARGAAPALSAELRGVGIEDGLVVDRGCGSGIWLAALAEAGFEGPSVDLSPDLLDLARGLAPRATLGSPRAREPHAHP